MHQETSCEPTYNTLPISNLGHDLSTRSSAGLNLGMCGAAVDAIIAEGMCAGASVGAIPAGPAAASSRGPPSMGGNYLGPFAKQQQGSGLGLDLSQEPPPKRSRPSKVRVPSVWPACPTCSGGRSDCSSSPGHCQRVMTSHVGGHLSLRGGPKVASESTTPQFNKLCRNMTNCHTTIQHGLS